MADDLRKMQLPNPQIAAWFAQTLREAFAHEGEQRARQKTVLVKRQAELAGAKDRLVKAYVNGVLDEGTLKGQSVDLDAQLREVQRGLEGCGDMDGACGDKAVELFRWTQNAAEDWRGSKIARKRVVLESLSLNRMLGDVSLCLEKRKPFRELSEPLSIQSNRIHWI